jgi:hypothetical protein
MTDLQDTQNARRLEAAKKLLLPRHIELAKKWVYWRDYGWSTEEEKNQAQSAYSDLHYALSNVILPTFDDLWLAAQRSVEEQMTDEERAQYRAMSQAREEYEWAIMEHGDALDKILQAEGEVKFADPRLVETDKRVDETEAALVALGGKPKPWRSAK